MPRDAGLEELVKSTLANTRGLSEKAMFGGWAWLLHGNLLCGARQGSLLLRVGKDNEAWANQIPGVATAIMTRPPHVRLGPRHPRGLRQRSAPPKTHRPSPRLHRLTSQKEAIT